MDAARRGRDFLHTHGMDGQAMTLEEGCQVFRAEMGRGLRGEPSSLMMLPAYLSLSQPLPRRGRAVALDAGGTNFRTALVEWADGVAQVSGVEVFPTPGSQGAVSREGFLDAIAQRLARYPAGCRVGFCFSFPAEIGPDLDGRVLLFDKEVQVDGGAGMHLCRDLAAHMAHRGMTPPERGAVVNDTTAALLGGCLTTRREDWDGLVGFVLGTGLNCCYCERTALLTKLSAPAGEDMVVNLEAGGFSRFPQGDFDRALDAASGEPGRNPLEKMTSGAYLGPLMLAVLQGAAREGLFTPACAQTVLALDSLPLQLVSPWLDGDDPNGLPHRLTAAEEDIPVLHALLDGLVDRAAGYIAAALTAVLLQGDLGRTAARPAAIMAEGSTFHKFRRYRGKIEENLTALCAAHRRHWRFASAGDANLLGAAAAALLGN